GVNAATGIFLDQAANVIAGTFAATDSTSGAVKFQDTAAGPLTIATIAASGCFTTTVTGVTGPADVTLCNTGDLILNAAVTAAAANTVRLTSSTGSVTQNASGVLSAANLGVSAATGIFL